MLEFQQIRTIGSAAETICRASTVCAFLVAPVFFVGWLITDNPLGALQLINVVGSLIASAWSEMEQSLVPVFTDRWLVVLTIILGYAAAGFSEKFANPTYSYDSS